MARHVFFSFHFKNDAWRVGQVRHSWIGQDRTANRFLDKAEWEKVEADGTPAVKRWIDRQIKGTSVTIVLVGSETSTRRFVKYEIEQSIKKGNGFVGVYIHKLKKPNALRQPKGRNPLDDYQIEQNHWLWGKKMVKLSAIYKSFDWEDDNGRKNLTAWIEEAAQIAERI